MQFNTRNFVILGLGLVLGVSINVGHSVFAERDKPAASLPLDDLRAFTEVMNKIKTDYVEPVEDKTLLQNAIRGMLSGLDPHSAYLDKEAFKDLQVSTTGEFGGLGIEVGMEDGAVKVISPIDDTPAQQAGIQAGDLIIRIDDTPVKGMTLSDAVSRMRGKPGTEITLTIAREGAEKLLKITLKRAVIKVSSVKGRTLEPGYGYLRISQFQANTGDNLAQFITKLKQESGDNMKGLVLDLRNNPGGVLNASVAVSDAFLDKGLIVYTDGRVKDSQQKFRATPGDILKGAPIVVLINGGSASASEIVAGALQDHKRAIVMGSKSFGKGSVQTVIPMDEGSALKLTTARYYTPSGRSIQAEGITPDIALENIKVTAVEGSGVDPVKEADLSGHLVNGSKKKTPEDSGKTTEETKPAADAKKTPEKLANTDYQLYEALNLLKGLSIMRERAP
ncbi:MAG: S41 family peptidase [Pseudomonadota bacterium]